MVRDSVILSVIQNGLTKYACYLFVLAAVVLVSCQKASERAESGPPPATAGNATSAQSETEIPANTVLWVQLKKDLDSSKLKVGDKFTGDLAEAVVLNGRDVVPKGATVKGHVSDKHSAQSQGTSGRLTLELDSLSVRGTDYQVKANPVTLETPPLATDAVKDTPVAPAVENAYAPKKGILQFFLTEGLRVKA
jgi:hypothetical protein